MTQGNHKRHRLRTAILGLAAVYLTVLVVYLAVLCWPPAGPTAATLNQIRPGMDRTEVEHLLGGPPGDHRHGNTIYDAAAVVLPTWQAFDADELTLATKDQWEEDGLLVVVRFDEAGKVRSAFGLLPSPPAWYRTLRRWLKLAL